MAKETFEEFKVRIDHAVDREELDDVRQMLLEETDLSFIEKRELSVYLDEIYKKSPELRR
jgi:hypothetical protein